MSFFIFLSHYYSCWIESQGSLLLIVVKIRFEAWCLWCYGCMVVAFMVRLTYPTFQCVWFRFTG